MFLSAVTSDKSCNFTNILSRYVLVTMGKIKPAMKPLFLLNSSLLSSLLFTRQVFSLLFLLLLFLYTPASVLSQEIKASNENSRGAIIVTLAGTEKLSEYFEWSCRSVSLSSSFFDMLVFHEGNKRLQSITCAKNVKFIDLGRNGLAKLIVSHVMGSGKATSEESRNELTLLLSEIITHMPRYLVEVKPMTGELFKDYLTTYSHWTFTDPDIIWGNIMNFLDESDLVEYDIITVAKIFDSGRLFIRGQFALHKNTPETSVLWKSLDYFSPGEFARRLANAVRMIRERKTSDEVFASNFYSSEGFYSEVVFKSGLAVKITGRGLDDYSQHPVILTRGTLLRVTTKDLVPFLSDLDDSSNDNIIQSSISGNFTTIKDLSPVEKKEAKAYHDRNECRMQWLPTDLRYCIAVETYDKDEILSQDKSQGKKLRLARVGEAIKEKNGMWYINDESKSKRQIVSHAAFFHFRHWDDYASTSIKTVFNDKEVAATANGGNGGRGFGRGGQDCMVLHLKNQVMAYEPCALVKSEMGGGTRGLRGPVRGKERVGGGPREQDRLSASSEVGGSSSRGNEELQRKRKHKSESEEEANSKEALSLRRREHEGGVGGGHRKRKAKGGGARTSKKG